MSTSPDKAPSPFRTVLTDGVLDQFYHTHEDALLAAAYGQGRLVANDDPHGPWIVRFSLKA